MSNRLAFATSPYLLQHADNPVDWWPWCAEALAEAKRRDVPILLSIGYAACHWCHVMAHESFSDEEIAARMNENFVNIKVDREERPDIDAVYMTATQAMTGQGGWPMTCFLTPEGEPFHCGTYYPAAAQPGMPSFPQLLEAVAQAWTDRRGELVEGAGKIAAALSEQTAPLQPAPVQDETLDTAVTTLAGESDRTNGGFGDAPKFPPSMVLEFLLRHHERTGSAEALGLAEASMDAMARGGIYDQLAGGFARYSVDAQWVVPHFEKMLYDNALLLRGYAHLARLTGSEVAGRVAEETAGFLLRELRTDEGAFAASLDADTEGVEGLTYVWTPQQLNDVLGADDGAWAAETFGVTAAGTFERGSSTLRLPSDPDDLQRFARVRATLLAARARRPQPDRDDKVVAAWNGLAITALAEAGQAFGHQDWLDAAGEAASFVVEQHVTQGRLRRTSRAGTVGESAGVLEDYGCLAEGLLALHQATGVARWLSDALGLVDTAVGHFADDQGESGVLHDTADDAEGLIQRPADPADNASPSGAAALANAALSASVLVGPEKADTYRAVCANAVYRAGALIGKVPRFAGYWLAAAEALRAGPVQVAVVGPDATARHDLLTEAVGKAHGGSVVLGGVPDADGIPLLAGRTLVDGAPAAYVCRGYVCQRPVTTVDDLDSALAS